METISDFERLKPQWPGRKRYGVEVIELVKAVDRAAQVTKDGVNLRQEQCAVQVREDASERGSCLYRNFRAALEYL